LILFKSKNKYLGDFICQDFPQLMLSNIKFNDYLNVSYDEEIMIDKSIQSKYIENQENYIF